MKKTVAVALTAVCVLLISGLVYEKQARMITIYIDSRPPIDQVIANHCMDGTAAYRFVEKTAAFATCMDKGKQTLTMLCKVGYPCVMTSLGSTPLDIIVKMAKQEEKSQSF